LILLDIKVMQQSLLNKGLFFMKHHSILSGLTDVVFQSNRFREYQTKKQLQSCFFVWYSLIYLL